MANDQLSLVLRHIRKMVGDDSCGGTDQELLARFASHREEAVFETLMERHGAMVLGVCRRVLSHEQDAEDVFQATFLVLARKAKSIRKRGSLGSWLYGVAYRLALKLRAAAARRRARERQASEMQSRFTFTAGEMIATPIPTDSTWSDLRPILDEELHRLPEKYRAPLVLCYLEGKTNVEAGRLLGWPAGSMSKRLARGRDLLRSRLSERGLALSTAALAAVLAENARAAIPAALWQSSLKAVVLAGAGHALTGVVSSQVGSLVHGVIHTMFMTKLVKVGLGLVLGVSILTMTAKLAMQPSAEAKSEDPMQEAAAAFAETPSSQPDLAQVPSNALGFVRIAFHDIWTLESMKPVRDQLSKSEPFQDMEKNLGISFADLQTLTFFMLPPGGGSQEPAILIAVTTNQPIPKEKLLGALVPEPQEKRHQGKTYFVSNRNSGGGPGPRPREHLFFAAEPAVHFVGDRLFLVGEQRELRRFFDRQDWAAGPSSLSAGLKLAEKKHALVAAFQISDQIHEEITRRPSPLGEAAFLRPLLDVQSGTLVLDFNETARLSMELSFPKEATAKESRNALATGLDMVKRLLATNESPELKNDELIAKMAREALAALETTQLTQEKQVVRGTLETKSLSLAATLLPAIQKFRVASKRMVSANNLKQIALAMHNYNDVYGRFPPQAISTNDGKPLLSWRVAILPFIEQDAVYRQFKLDEPWDSEHNKKLLAQMPPIYAPVHVKTKEKYETFYQAFAGKGSAFEPGEKIRIQDILDGTSNTLLVVEGGDSVPWTKPEDLPFDPAKPLPQLGAEFPDIFLAAFCDGSVRELPKKIDADKLRALITRNGGEVVTLP